MKNILVIVGEYLPYSSTNGNIANNIVKELKNYGYNVIVLTRKNKIGLKNNDNIDEIEIKRIRDLNLIIHDYCLENIKKKKTIFKLLLQIKRIVFYIPKVFRKTSVSKYYMKKIEKSIKKINKEKKIDVIIPVSAPHEEIFASMNFKKKNKDTKLFAYQLDRFSNEKRLYPSKLFKNRKMKNNIKLELELLKECNNLFVLPPIYEYYKDNKIYVDYLNKIIMTEHPLIKNMKTSHAKNENELNIIYAGALYSKLRNPTYLFKIMDTNIIEESNFKLYLYAFGDCQEVIDKYCHKLEGHIYDKGKVSHEVIVKKMQEADILLSIGNNSDTEVPSKLFEYLSLCKPIIHLYYSDKDAYIEYLKNYKYSICIKMDEKKINENSKVFYDFCIRNSKVNIDYKDVEKNFESCTPKYVAEKFINQIEGEKQ